MITKRRGVLGLIATGLGAMAVPGRNAVGHAADATGTAQGLEGTWVLGTPGVGAPQRIHATFTGDGSAVVTTSLFPRQSPAQGVWERTGDREFAATFVHLRHDDGGRWIGLTKVRQAIRLSETLDEYHATTIAEDLDLDGNVVATRTPMITFRRMRVEPLS
jgi:hypothetical protein